MELCKLIAPNIFLDWWLNTFSFVGYFNIKLIIPIYICIAFYILLYSFAYILTESIQ